MASRVASDSVNAADASPIRLRPGIWTAKANQPQATRYRGRGPGHLNGAADESLDRVDAAQADLEERTGVRCHYQNGVIRRADMHGRVTVDQGDVEHLVVDVELVRLVHAGSALVVQHRLDGQRCPGRADHGIGMDGLTCAYGEAQPSQAENWFVQGAPEFGECIPAGAPTRHGRLNQPDPD